MDEDVSLYLRTRNCQVMVLRLVYNHDAQGYKQLNRTIGKEVRIYELPYLNTMNDPTITSCPNAKITVM